MNEETYLASQDTENSLMKIHNGIIAALVPVNDGVSVQTDN